MEYPKSLSEYFDAVYALLVTVVSEGYDRPTH